MKIAKNLMFAENKAGGYLIVLWDAELYFRKGRDQGKIW